MAEAREPLVRLEQKVFEELRARVFVITMCNGENRFNPTFMNDFLGCLDQIEHELRRLQEETAGLGGETAGWGAAVITTGGGGQPRDKFYSNGIDLNWVEQRRRDGDTAALRTLGRLFGVATARLLSFPLPTFAVLNGHCFAGAFMLAMAHDYRLMQADRGWLCLPALDLGITLAAPFYAMLQRKLPSPQVLRQVAFECRRYTGDEACRAGLVDWSGPAKHLMTTALEWAAERASKGAGRHAQALGSLKQALYGPVVQEMMVGTSIDYPLRISPGAAKDTTGTAPPSSAKL